MKEKKQKFEVFLSQLIETNTTLASLTDFAKVQKNVNKIAVKLCQLNHLIGREDLESAVREIYDENPHSFEVLGMLLAVRDNKSIRDSKGAIIHISEYFTNVENICNYINESGLREIFTSKRVTNLVDYVFGVEVGLDTNARKNRGGEIMEHDVAQIFDEARVPYSREVSSLDLSGLDSLGQDVKRFDFVIKSAKTTYLIEANFYNSKGSKLNETARSYTDICPKINAANSYEFVWITDGQGWLSAKNKLEEAYNIIPSVYNLTTISNFIQKIKAEIDD